MAALAIGVFVSMAAFVGAPMIQATNTDVSHTFEIAENETETLDSSVQVKAQDVNATSGNVTLRYRDVATDQTVTDTIGEGNQSTISLAGENVTTTNEEITGADTARLTVRFAPTYGWDDGSKSLADRFDVLIALILFVLVMMGAFVWMV